MPKQTFLNLPDGKRGPLVEALLTEFAQNGYRQASLDRIARQGGVSKGSLYQYFENKLDMYTWLIQVELPRRKMAALHDVPMTPGADLFDTLAVWFGAGLQFFVREPRLARLATSMMDPTAEPEIRSMHREGQRNAHAYLRNLVTEAMARGEVRSELDPDLVTVLISKIMGSGLSEALLLRMGLDVVAFGEDPSLVAAIPKGELADLVCEATEILRRAVG